MILHEHALWKFRQFFIQNFVILYHFYISMKNLLRMQCRTCSSDRVPSFRNRTLRTVINSKKTRDKFTENLALALKRLKLIFQCAEHQISIDSRSYIFLRNLNFRLYYTPLLQINIFKPVKNSIDFCLNSFVAFC